MGVISLPDQSKESTGYCGNAVDAVGHGPHDPVNESRIIGTYRNVYPFFCQVMLIRARPRL